MNSQEMNNVFEIVRLKCKYPSNLSPVLVIDKLCIERGSNTFFIGPSGVGKSTILETLGLMNNTIYNSTENNTLFTFTNTKNESIHIHELWNQKEQNIAAFRNKHLSFIFQNTNLFKSLSAFDNIIISAILQGKSKAEAVKRTKNIIQNILPDVTIDKPITELSGGQRQRIAFARAIVSDYSVLFADEPTGNLDVGNAEKLMKILIENVESKTSIIVTHDIDLAVKFATKIVLIRNDENTNSHGLIDEQSIFLRVGNNEWTGFNKRYSSNEISQKFKTEIFNHNSK
ncbi:MAG: hypothetical protein COA49_03330 [Bacteroidetes bacterium]|nr:MAG: hypothetical protein COA49_03330 [Bacteroidota bacterium]